MMGKKKMAMKRGGGVKGKGKKKAVKKRGGGMLEMAMGGKVSPRKKMAMGMAMKRGGSPKKKMAKGGALRKAITNIKFAKPVTGRSAAAKKAAGSGITKATKTAMGKLRMGKGNPAGKDMSDVGRMTAIASAFMKRRKDLRKKTPGGGMSPKRKK